MFVSAPPAATHRDDTASRLLAALAVSLENASPLEILSVARTTFGNRLAVVSSFGTESAVLLHMMAQVDPSIAVLFLDTGYSFPETLAYRDTLVERLGFTNVQTLAPNPAAQAAEDPDGDLYARNADACCALRKVEPLERGLAPFDAWINGRKRYQAATRAQIPVVELDGSRVKFSPLAGLGAAEIDGWMSAHNLPRHPLAALGFTSIGCMPCTSRVRPGEDPRAGRWRGSAKTECGIHSRPAR